MAQKPYRLEKFWKELKRREVFSVATTYIATSYIIIEVTNNLIVPLHLPDWVATLVLIILVTGLPIALILAWIFDFTSKGIERTESLEESGNKEIISKPFKSKLRVSYLLNGILIIAVIILAYPKIFNRNTLEKLRSSGELISVAVMPFQNMTNDTIWDVWQAGIQTNIITSLSNNPDELKVRQTESISGLLKSKGVTNYASITPSVASVISKKLDANIFINGSINQSGSTVRLNAQLFNSGTRDAIRSFQIDGADENILNLIDTLSTMVKNFLIISKLRKELPGDYSKGSSTYSPEAFRYFLYGNIAFFKKMDYPSAINFYNQALTIDSNFLSAITMLATSYYNQRQFDQAKLWCLKGCNRDHLPIGRNIHMNWLHAMLFETPLEEIKYLNQLLEIDDQSPAAYYELGRIYVSLAQYEEAISVMIKAMEIYKKWGSKPRWVQDYIMLGYAYQETNRFNKEKKLFRKAAKDFPDDPELLYRRAVLALSLENTKDADRLIEEFVSSSKSNLASEADIAWSLGDIYWDAAKLEKAESKFRESLSLEPGNLRRINYFAYFLIDNDRNFDEGLRLIDTALQQYPDNYYFLHTKGWGQYKVGKYQEAMDILQKSWDLRRDKAVYDHDAFLHLEAAKKAVTSQKNN